MSDDAHNFAWQGLRLSTPRGWEPRKLEGDHASGYALLADMNGPRLGVRWAALGRRPAAAAVLAAMRTEVGTLAAKEAVPLTHPHFDHGTFYQEPHPPGRDVWIGVSPATHRLVVLTQPCDAKNRTPLREVLNTLTDTPLDQPQQWSVFGLNVTTPPGLKLAKPALLAGDLTLEFVGRGRRMAVREIAPATLALARRSAEKWLLDAARKTRKHYLSPSQVQQHNGLLRCTVQRKRRFFFRRDLPRMLTLTLRHEEASNRLLIHLNSGEDTVIPQSQALFHASLVS